MKIAGHSLHRLVVSLLFCLTAAVASAAETAVDKAEGELMDAFTDLCLNRFPSEPAFAKGASERQLTPMKADAVKQYLHNDPGRGWYGSGGAGTYVVTLESPPYLACAVRRMQKPTASVRTSFQQSISNWAASRKIGPPRAMAPVRQVRDDMTIDVTAQAIAGPNGKPWQVFMVFVTDYPSGRTEVRFVRQFPPN